MRQCKIAILSMMLMISATSLFGQKTAAVITAKNTDVLYAGIPNPITIESSVSAENLVIDWGGATAKQMDGQKYELNVPASFAGKEITINISEKLEDGKLQKINSATYRVKLTPEPVITIGEEFGSGRQGREAILANPSISVKMPADFLYDLNWQVLSYRVVFVRNGVEEAPITAKGARLADNIIERIQNAPSGTIIEFSDIQIQSIAGTRTIASTLVIRIQ